jgi:hypothetical protein
MFRCLLILLVLIPWSASAGVTSGDDIAVTGQPVMLRAETRGWFFRAGGVLVDFRVDGISLGSVMSGGDGMAYREFKPPTAGLLEVVVQAGGEQASGHLLVLDKGSGIVLVDVVGSLLENPVSRRPRTGSVDAMTSISHVHHVAYVNVLGTGGDFMKTWLAEQGFPDGPLLSLNGGRVFDHVSGLGIVITAVVGSDQVVSEAAEYGALLFSFDSTEGERRVSSWSEIQGALAQKEP